MKITAQFLVLFVWTLNASQFVSSRAQAATEKAKVVVDDVKPVNDIYKIILPVKVEAKTQSVVSSDIEGHVVKIVKELGAAVKAGDVVLYLENKDPGFTYATVPVRSPIVGVIAQLSTSHMTKVNRGDKLFTVINPKSLKMTAEVPSSDLHFLKAGERGHFVSAATNQIGVQIEAISPLVDVRTGTASAEFKFEDSKSALPPIGSLGQVVFEIKKGTVILVPESSLSYQDGKPMIKILNEQNSFTKKSIELGEQKNDLFVVKSGVSSGDKIILRASRALKDGEQVEIENPQGMTK